MTTRMVPDSVSISSLNTLEYCPRRFYYEFVQCDMLVNEFVLEGTLQHQRVHQPGKQTRDEGEMQTTHVYLYSETLHLSGFTDVIEEQDGMLVPVEYKHGRQGQWLNDYIQLCAQALCLEERGSDHNRGPGDPQDGSMGTKVQGYIGSDHNRGPGDPQGVSLPYTGGPLSSRFLVEPALISHGYIYYLGSRRRVRVDFTPELREKTLSAIAHAFSIAALDKAPGPLDGPLAARCPNCSLQPLCMPDEVKLLQSRKRGK